jgi:hypothetical protein
MNRRMRDLAVLALVWMGVTLPFLDKAYHIDDTVHVLQAEHIAANPTRPLEMEIFWFQWPEWLADSNPITPPAWPYELAAATALCGSGEKILNSLAAFHVLMLGIAVYCLAARMLEGPLLAALFVVTAPAAVVGRNVMLDVPMLSYLVAGLAAVVAGVEDERIGLRIAGALLIGVASVTKLPGIVGVPVLLIYLVLCRRLGWLPLAGVALGPLALWYAYQLAATGGIDILRSRGGGGFEPRYSLATAATVGLGHVPFWGGTVFTGVAFLATLTVGRRRLALLVGSAGVLAGLLAGVLVGLGRQGDESGGSLGLLVPFTCAGVALAVGAAMGAWRLWHAGGGKRPLAGLLVAWAIGHVAFALAGAWEMNVRMAYLSAVPATLLCLAAVEGVVASSVMPRPVMAAAIAMLVVGTVVSLQVARADTEWADGYRRVAGEIARVHAGRRVWFVGHWGFQHYATAAGMTPYSPRDDRLAPGDVLIVPLIVARQDVPPAVERRLTAMEQHTITPALPLRTMTGGGGFYSTGWGPMPWGWSRDPADVVMVMRYD